MSLGGCDLPMLTGYVHTVYPRQTVSFKLGSALREVGVLHADVSTAVAGVLGKRADNVGGARGVQQPADNVKNPHRPAIASVAGAVSPAAASSPRPNLSGPHSDAAPRARAPIASR